MQSSICQALSYDAVTSAESLAVMMQKERTIYVSRDYLQPTSGSVVTQSDRQTLVDWCYGIVDKCDLDRETVASAMGLVDRFLSTSSAAALEALGNRGQFQLVVLAALYVAIKVHEKAAFGSDFFAVVSRGIYSVDDIEAAERTLLQDLGWRVNAPTSVQAAHAVLSLALPHVDLRDRTWAFLLDEVRYQCEVAVRDYRLATRRPSTVALAAIFNALDQLGPRDRRAMSYALMIVMNEDFDAPEEIVAAKERLVLLLKDDAAVPEDGSAASDAPMTERASFSSVMGLDYHSLDDNPYVVSPSSSL